jgi:predicted RNase H-like HicB family nuclease
MSKATTLDREFEPSAALIKKARRYLARYSVMIHPKDHGGYWGTATELPGVIASGETLDKCARNLSFALETVIASYLADGETPPKPAVPEKRTEQVNVRFTRSERNLLQRASAKQGFRGIGDLIRAEVIRTLSANT